MRSSGRPGLQSEILAQKDDEEEEGVRQRNDRRRSGVRREGGPL